jgi:hypothetical protein
MAATGRGWMPIMPIAADTQNPIRFIILTNGRSGSNFVVNILNQHPAIVNYGEILGDWTLPHRLFKALRWLGWDWPRFIHWMLGSRLAHRLGQIRTVRAHRERDATRTAKAYSGIQAVGFKDFFFLIERNGLSDFITKGDFRIIYLTRDDSLARAISLQRMAASGQAVAHHAEGKLNRTLLAVDTDRLLRDLDAMAQEKLFETELMAKCDSTRIFKIDYQDYFFDAARMEEINQAMFGFLGLAGHGVHAEHRRISGGSLASEIANLPEVRACLKGTRHAALVTLL